MKHRFSLTVPVLAALASLSLSAVAAENRSHDHAAPAASPKLSYKGHAAALGRPGQLKAATRTVEIDMADDMRFTPERIEIKQGETVRFIAHNRGEIKHEMVLGTIGELRKHAAVMAKFPEMEHDDPNAVSVEPGKSGEFAWTFSKPGSFDFACLVAGHFEAGMIGKVTVVAK